MSTCGNTESPKPKPENKDREMDVRRLKAVVVQEPSSQWWFTPALTFIIKLIINTTVEHLSGEDVHDSPYDRTGDCPEKSSKVNWWASLYQLLTWNRLKIAALLVIVNKGRVAKLVVLNWFPFLKVGYKYLNFATISLSPKRQSLTHHLVNYLQWISQVVDKQTPPAWKESTPN